MNIFKLTQTFLVAFIMSIGTSHSQNIPLDFDALDNWPKVSSGGISSGGDYSYYDISRPNRPLETVLKSTDGRWVKHLYNIYEKHFSYNADEFWYRSGDTLFVQQLGKNQTKQITDLKDYKQFVSKGNFYELLYKKDGSLTVEEVIGKRKFSVHNVAEFSLDSDNGFLVLRSAIKDVISLKIVSLSRLSYDEITIPKESKSILFDKSYLRIAYLDNQDRINTIELRNMAQRVSRPIPDIESLKSFNGHNIILYIVKPLLDRKDRENDIVDIWDYKDPLIKSAQLAGVSYFRGKSVGVYNRNNDSYFIANSNSENLEELGSNGYAIVSKVAGTYNERYWNDSAYVRSTLLNLTTMKKTILDCNSVHVSPDGKFIIGYNEKLRDFVQVDLKTMKSFPLTLDLPITNNREHNYPGDSLKRFLSFVGFTLGGDMIFYDDYDIWLLDKDHKRPGKNLTGFNGRNTHTIFRLVKAYNQKLDIPSQELLLTGFTLTNSENNFYSLSGKGLRKLSDDSFFYGLDDMGEFPGTQLIKASRKNVWMVKRESATLQPNFAITSNFKDFTTVSDVNLATKYNWLGVEMYSYPNKDKKMLKGLVYFPQDFDKEKKYPVIFHFYEIKSHKKNLFQFPDYAHDEINIPWMVSHGYVVFVPDIEVEAGKPGESIKDCIMGGYDFIKSQTWADTLRLGLNGHSYGANEVLYIITQTHKFAAAVAASGLSDLVAAVGNVTQGEGMPHHREWAEIGQGRIGATLWDNPGIYVKNSPVFQSNRVTTPLLLMNNKKDDIIDFSQGVEMFTSLRRLKKQVWMLQYDRGYHSIYDKESEKDFTLKLDDFYGYFLKSLGKPKWMK